MHGHWFYTTKYGAFGDGGKDAERSPANSLTGQTITQSKGFTRKVFGKVSRSVRAYVYLVLTSQVQAKPSVVGNSASAVDAQ